MQVRIVIFEDNHNLRESLASLLDHHENFQVAGQYEDCMKVTEVIKEVSPDVVLMDIDMPGMSGIDGVIKIKEERPETAVIIYTVFEDDEKLFQCLCAGANGYLLKRTSPKKIVEAILEVLDGGAPMSPQVARKVLNTFHPPTSALRYSLTPRETEVLQFLMKGYGSKQIAATMFLSVETIRSYLKNVYRKLHVNCGKEAIVKALQERII